MKEELNKVGEWFKNQRDLRGEDLHKQSEALGIGATAICHYSYGRRLLSKKMVDRIIKAYDLKGEEKRDFYKATLTQEDIIRAKTVKSKEMSVFDVAIMMKYGE